MTVSTSVTGSSPSRASLCRPLALARPGLGVVGQHRDRFHIRQQLRQPADTFFEVARLIHAGDVVAGVFDAVDQAVLQRIPVNTPEHHRCPTVDILVTDIIGSVIVTQQHDIRGEGVKLPHDFRDGDLDFGQGVVALGIHPPFTDHGAGALHRTLGGEALALCCVVQVIEFLQRADDTSIGILRPEVVGAITADNGDAASGLGRRDRG